MKNLTCWIMGFLVVLFTNGICFGVTIYVDQSGGGDFSTINAAINAALSGDTIKVGPGIYPENVVINKNVNIIGSGPQHTTVEASGDGIVVQAVTTEIAQITITAAGHGVYFTSDHATGIVRNSVIEGCGGKGLWVNANYCSVTLTNNTIISNGGNGIDFDSGIGQGYAQGNIVCLNDGIGIHSDLIWEDELFLSNNNVYGNLKSYDINYYSDFPGGTGCISVNPFFIDVATGNYALQSNSECLDVGIPGETFNDPDGTRNDMGAFSGPPSAAFWPYISRGPAVTEITLTPASVPRGGTITIQAKGRVQ